MLYVAEMVLVYYGYYFLLVFFTGSIIFLLCLTVWFHKFDSLSHQDKLDMEETMTVINLCEFRRRKEDTV